VISGLRTRAQAQLHARLAAGGIALLVRLRRRIRDARRCCCGGGGGGGVRGGAAQCKRRHVRDLHRRRVRRAPHAQEGGAWARAGARQRRQLSAATRESARSRVPGLMTMRSRPRSDSSSACAAASGATSGSLMARGSGGSAQEEEESAAFVPIAWQRTPKPPAPLHIGQSCAVRKLQAVFGKRVRTGRGDPPAELRRSALLLPCMLARSRCARDVEAARPTLLGLTTMCC
jgi:hypothetical protein